MESAPLAPALPDPRRRKVLVTALNGTASGVPVYYLVWGLRQGAKLKNPGPKEFARHLGPKPHQLLAGRWGVVARGQRGRQRRWAGSVPGAGHGRILMVLEA